MLARAMSTPTFIDNLWEATRNGQVDAADFPPMTLAEGQRANLALLERHCAAGDRAGGWKLGLTSGSSRDAFGPGIRPFGHILESRIFSTGAQLARFDGMRLENELCFTLASPLAGEAVTAAQARAAVTNVAPAFEINQQRLTGFADQGLRVAENLSQWGIVVGAGIDISRIDDLDAIEIALAWDDEVVERVAACGHIDDHFGSIARLARELSEHGREIGAGDRIITGAYTRHSAEPGRWRGIFGPQLGEVEVRVRAS